MISAIASPAIGVDRRDGLLRGVAEASRILLAGPDLSQAMSSAAAVLGEYTGCDRIAIYRFKESGDDAAWYVEAIWEAPGVPSLIAIHGAGPLHKRDRADVCHLHLAGRPWMSHTRDLPEDQRRYNQAIGTLSNAKMPVYVDGAYWGFVAFSDCSSERDWSAGEIHVLESLGAVLGAAVARDAIVAERAKAAQDRYVELVNANEALRRSSEHMCSLERLDVYLSNVLDACLPLTGAVAGRVALEGEADDEPRIIASRQQTDIRQPWPLVPLSCAAVGGSNASAFRWAETLCPELPLGWCEWHHKSGHSRALFLPLVIRNQRLGFIELAFREGHDPSELHLQSVQVLARQAAFAVQLGRLANDAQQTAVARERERAAIERARELAEANEALSRTVARLTSHSDLNDFLLSVTQETMRTVDAASGGVFLYERASHALAARAIITRAGDDLHVDALWECVCSEKRICWLDRDARRSTAAIPMILDDQPIGFLALGFDTPADESPTDLRMELCRTLAQQATLAVRLSDLAEQARQTAIAKEREDLATSRATELSAAAAALRRTGGHLAESPEISSFVHEVLHEATRHTGAAIGAWFRYSAREGTLQLTSAVDDASIEINTDPRMEPLRKPVPFTSKREWRRLLEGEPVLTDVSKLSTGLGCRYGLAVPVLVGSRIIGCLVLWFAIAEPDVCKIELLQALAQQTAVAIHLSELAERSRDAAVLAERANLARELHDTLLQGFTGVTLQLRALLRRAPDDRKTLYETLARIEHESTQAVQEARRAVGDMRTAGGDENLVQAIATVLENIQTPTGVNVELNTEGEHRSVPSETLQTMQRIAREATSNALRHAQPRNVHVRVSFRPGWIALSVEDDGSGFDAEQAPLAEGRHFGLLGMQERAQNAGGRYELVTAPGQGTRVHVEVPG